MELNQHFTLKEVKQNPLVSSFNVFCKKKINSLVWNYVFVFNFTDMKVISPISTFFVTSLICYYYHLIFMYLIYR